MEFSPAITSPGNWQAVPSKSLDNCFQMSGPWVSKVLVSLKLDMDPFPNFLRTKQPSFSLHSSTNFRHTSGSTSGSTQFTFSKQAVAEGTQQGHGARRLQGEPFVVLFF